MGVKKHCVSMHKLGWLETWRRPIEVGRPEKIYRVTSRVDCLFPQIGSDLSLEILEAAVNLEPHAAEKLLFAFFRQQTENMAKVVTGNSVQERAEKLSSERDKLGYYSECVFDEEAETLSIEEYHNPLQPLFDKYPSLARMEIQMFERLLVRARVERQSETVGAVTRYRFELSPK